MSTGTTELLWALSLMALCVGGWWLRELPPNREAALCGVAAGLGIGVWLAAFWWIHVGVS